jgi:hypothetical protein
MRTKTIVVGGMAILLAAAVASPVRAQEKKAEGKGEKAEKSEKAAPAEKAKAQKVSGDIGLLDTEKNYMIVVTKEGKLVTLDFDQKTKLTEIKESQVKMAEIGLGASAAVEYSVKGEKNFLNKIEFSPAKGE